MEFGMPVLLALNTLEEQAALCTELGLKFVEINMSMPQHQIELLKHIQLPARDELYYTIHMDEAMDPFSFNPRVRDAYLQTTLDIIRYAAENGIPTLNMHILQGIFVTLPTGKVAVNAQFFDDYIGCVRSFRNAVARELRGTGIKFCIENTAFSGTARIEDILDTFLEEDCFALTYDTGHDLMDDGKATPFYQARRDRLGHMHFHDCVGKKDHRPLGTGDVEKEKMLEWAKEQNCRVLVEVKAPEELRRSVAWLRERNYME